MIPSSLEGSQCFTLVMSTLRPGECPDFFAYTFNADPGLTYFGIEGWGTAQTNISVPIVQSIPVAAPDADEQLAIVDFLRREIRAIDELSHRVELAMDRLQEYRTALVSAAVTGKVDVRSTVCKSVDMQSAPAREGGTAWS